MLNPWKEVKLLQKKISVATREASIQAKAMREEAHSAKHWKARAERAERELRALRGERGSARASGREGEAEDVTEQRYSAAWMDDLGSPYVVFGD